MRFQVLAIAAALVPVCASAHVCPVQAPGKSGAVTTQFIDTHDPDKKVYATAKLARAKGASASFLNTHDEPIIITDGSVNINLGYAPATDSSGNLTRHACPGPHIVQVTTWSWDPLKRRAQPATTSTVFNDPAADPKATNVIRMWVEQPGGATVQATGAPSSVLTLDAANNMWALTPFGGLVKQANAGSWRSQAHRMSWIQIGGNRPRPLRASCYAVQIFHAWAKPGDNTDADPKPLDEIAPACVSNIKSPILDRDWNKGPGPDLKKLPDLKQK